MTAEAIPLSVNSDDNLRVTRTNFADNPLSVAILDAGDDLTYSLSTLGISETQVSIPDKRVSLKQDLQRPGKTTVAIEVQYVFGDDGDVAGATLTEGSTGNITLRYSIANSTAWATAQVADTLAYTAGAQRKDAPVENGLQTISQTLYISGLLKKDQAIIV